jgi:hypothetical protein
VSIDHFETRYIPGLGARYAVRSWIVSAVVAAIGVVVTWGTYAANPQWWVIPVLVVAFVPLVAAAVVSALEAPGKWGADERLALRLDADGLTLPRIGRLAWNEITAIRIVDTGWINASTWVRAWEAQTGSSSSRFVTVWVRDAEAVVARTGGVAAAFRNLHRLDGAGGFDGVWGIGLRSPGWHETVTAIQHAGAAHGIRLLGKAAISMDPETKSSARKVWLTDRYGRSIEDDVTLDLLSVQLDTIAVPDGDDEHGVISLADSDEWGLEYSRTAVVFENVDVGGERVGVIRGATPAERLAIGAEFLAGDFAALRARTWAAEAAPPAEHAVLDYVRGMLVEMMKPGDTELRHVVEWRLGDLHQGMTRAYHPQGEFESAEGRFNRAIPPRNLYGAIGSLRSAMYRPGVGTWFSAEFRVSAEGALTTSFAADTEPAWGSGVTPAAIIADLAEFPRDEEHTPSWLRDRLAGIPAPKPHDPADDDPRPVLPTGQWRELARAVTARFVDGLDLEGAAVPPGVAPFVRLPKGFSLSRSSTDGSFAAQLVTVLAVYGETVRAGRAVAELGAFPFQTHRVPDPSTWAIAVQVVAFFARRHGDTETVASLQPLLEVFVHRGVTDYYLSGRLLRNPLDETPRAGIAIPDDRGRASSYLLQLRSLASMAEYGASEAYPRERIDAEVERYLDALFALRGFEPPPQT